MTLGDFLLENFADDLEYHPRRAAVYLGLSISAACFWIFSPPNTKFTAVPLVFALGSLTLFVKGVFLVPKGRSPRMIFGTRNLSVIQSLQSQGASFDSSPSRADRSGFRRGRTPSVAHSSHGKRHRQILGQRTTPSDFLGGCFSFLSRLAHPSFHLASPDVADIGLTEHASYR